MEQTMSRTQTPTTRYECNTRKWNRPCGVVCRAGADRPCGVVCRAGAGARRERDVMSQENPQTV